MIPAMQVIDSCRAMAIALRAAFVQAKGHGAKAARVAADLLEEAAEALAQAEPPAPPAFGVLVRHEGWIDQMLGTAWESGGEYPPTSVPDDTPMATFVARQEADRAALACAERWGGRRYRFSVVERCLVPRWFIVDPKRDREKRPVGSCEQL